MPLDARSRAWLALHLIDGLGPRRVHALLSALGSPEAALDASAPTLREIVGPALAEAIRRGPEPAQVQESERWLGAEPNRWLIAWDDDRYPRSLLTVPDPPPVLFFTGDVALLNRPALAIVGSRHATPVGLENAEAFARALGDAGLTIVSGLALGIDAAAHRGGLASASSSLAVVGTGLDRVYPARNLQLARRLGEAGGLLSEFAVGTPPLTANFPRRNRVISGLALGVLVVEATLDSGSLITARLAAEQGRDVFAVPGSIHSPLSKGPHRLIRDGAKLVETAEDVLSELQVVREGAAPEPVGASDSSRRHRPGAPGPDSARVLEALGFDPAPLDLLGVRTGLPASRLLVALTALELDGAVAIDGAGRYLRLAPRRQ